MSATTRRTNQKTALSGRAAIARTLPRKPKTDHWDVPPVDRNPPKKPILADAPNAPVGSKERDYARTLMSAGNAVGAGRLYDALEEAERTGKRIALIEPVNGVYGEPMDIELI